MQEKRHNRYRLLWLLIPAVGLALCVVLLIGWPIAVAYSWFATATATASPTSTPTPTATATATPTPTFTPTPTPTFTPTPTPVVLPVGNDTPVPDLPYEVITVENFGQLRPIARYGYPRLLVNKPFRLTADGTTIVVGTTGGIEYYDARTHEKTGGFPLDYVYLFDVTPDGEYVLTLIKDTLTVWTRDGQKINDLPLGKEWRDWFGRVEGFEITGPLVALSPDGTLVAVQRRTAWDEQKKVDVYRVSDGVLVDTVRGQGIVFSPDGRYLATEFNGLRLYPVAELGEGWERRLPKQSLPTCGLGCALVFSPDGELAALVNNDRVDVYHVSERRLVRQVSGWQVPDFASLVAQFTPDSKRLVIAIPAIYSNREQIRVPAKAILVDIASGEWVDRREIPPEAVYAYATDDQQMQLFEWQTGGEWLWFSQPDVRVQDTSLILSEFIAGKHLLCVNRECTRTPAKNRFVDQNGTAYTLTRHGSSCKVVRESDGQVLASFSAPAEAYVGFWVFPHPKGDVVVVYWGVLGSDDHVRAYRSDGRQARIFDDRIVGEPVFDGQGRIAFSNYTHLKILDIEQWSVASFYAGRDIFVLRFVDGKVYCAKTWRAGTSVWVVDPSTRQTLDIPVPEWRGGSSWNESGYEVVESADKAGDLFVVSTGGLLYAIDLRQNAVVAQLPLSIPYSNLTMRFSPDGRFLFTYGQDGYVRIWGVFPEEAK